MDENIEKNDDIGRMDETDVSPARQDRVESAEDFCYMHLLFPGYDDQGWERHEFTYGSDVGGFQARVRETMRQRMKAECGDPFLTDDKDGITRYNYGALTVRMIDYETGGEACNFRGWLSLAVHRKTRYCIMECYIENPPVEPEAVLEQYSDNQLTFSFGDAEGAASPDDTGACAEADSKAAPGSFARAAGPDGRAEPEGAGSPEGPADGPFAVGKKYTDEEVMAGLGITPCGTKRSMVFIPDPVDDEQIIRVLANESIPMGRIGGDFQAMLYNNIAQYDTARVYISSATMIECCSPLIARLMTGDPVAYQCSELFFVEILMLQDAGSMHIHQRIMDLMNRQSRDADLDLSDKELEELNYELIMMSSFSNFSQFHFPTVRLSAQKISEAFGIQDIRGRLNTNKAILEEIIETDDARSQAEQEKIRNRFLGWLTVLSSVSAIMDLFSGLTGGRESLIVTLIVLAVAAVSGGAYLLYNRSYKKRKEAEKLGKKV
ncbi:MAG: hypothetical protein PUB39_05540 [Eubacteriales bacterium]|nr:hypothetical protein [Eubacteriales bacterium]